MKNMGPGIDRVFSSIIYISHININGEPKPLSLASTPRRQAGFGWEWSHFEEHNFLLLLGGVCLPECQRDARTEAKSVAIKNTG